MSDPLDPLPSKESQEQEQCQNLEPTDAAKPFGSSAKADAILRSSDSVDFFILKGFLSFASSVFDSMFSLNQGDTQKSEDISRNGLPVVPLAEHSATLYNLLILVYPYAKKPDLCPSDYIETVKAARKYAMDEVEQKLRNQFTASTIFRAEPLRAFAMAVHLGWQKDAEKAARITLARGRETLGHCDELRLISATDYIELWEWRSKCQKAAEAAVNDFPWGQKAYSFGPNSPFSTLSSTEIATIKWAILEQLRKKRCPQGGVVDNDIIGEIFDRLGCEIISDAKDILDACHMIATRINEATSKILFKQPA